MAAPTIPATGSGTAAASASVSTSSTVTWSAGDKILAAVTSRDSADNVSSVTATGLTFADSGLGVVVQSRTRSELWIATAASGGTQTITASTSGSWDSVNLHVAVVRSSTGTLAKDTQNSGGANSNAPSVSLTTTNNDCRVIGFIGWSQTSVTPTVGSGYSETIAKTNAGTGGNISELWTEDKTQATAGTFNVDASLSGSANWTNLAIAYYEVASSITVNAGLGSLTFTSLASTVTSTPTTVTATLGSLTFTSLQSTVTSTPTTVTATLGSVTFTSLQATVLAPLSVTATLGSITFTSLQASIVADLTITATLGSLTFTSLQATVTSTGTSVAANLGSLTFTSLQATVIAPITVTATLGAITFTSLASTVDAGATITINATLGALTFTSLQSTVIAPLTVTATLGALTFTSLASTISTDTVVTATLGALTFTSLQSTVIANIQIDAALGSVTFTSLQASVSLGSTVTVTATLGSITFTSLAASVDAGPITVTATLGGITFTGLSATIDDGLGIDHAPGIPLVTLIPSRFEPPIPHIEVTGNRFIGSHRDVIHRNFQERVNSYSHTINANGGYWSANMSFSETRDGAFEWIRAGIGNEVTVRNQSGTIVWQGFINSLTVDIGYVSVQVGPLLDVINKLSLSFTTTRYDTKVPYGGVQYNLPYVENTDSQAIYGIMPGIENGGTGSLEEALELQNIMIAQRAYPEVSKNFNGGGAAYNISVECVGYAQYLQKPTLTNLGTTGYENASTRVINAVGADPNSIFDTGNVDTNTLQVGVPSGDSKNSWEIIKSAVVLGDTDDNRYIFGVYEEARCFYAQIPSTYTYLINYSNNDYVIRNADSGLVVYPWDIRPGQWIKMQDIAAPSSDSFVSVGTVSYNLERDISSAFIESITYTAPWGLSFNGGKTSRIEQQLAKMGTGGTF